MIENRKDFAADMRREHRTNQQLDARPIFEIINQWAADFVNGNCDARNEASCKLAFDMVFYLNKYGDYEAKQMLRNLSFPYI